MLQRKIISAFVTGALFAILLGFLLPNPMKEQVVTNQSYWYSATSIIHVYLMYILPVMLMYGVLVSIISDKIAEFVSKKNNTGNIEIIVSGVFHILFGLILLPYSVGAALLFFMIDRILKQQNKTFNWFQTIKSVIIPLAVWLVSLSVIWIEHFINNM